MSRYNPKVFTNVDSLNDIKPELIHQLLSRFSEFCKEQELNLNNGVITNDKICETCLNAGASEHEEAHELMEALQSISEMANLNSRAVLGSMAKAQSLTLLDGPDVSDADFAIYCWLNQPNLFAAAYAKGRVKNYQSFLYFNGKTSAERHFPEITEDKTAAIQADINAWLKENGRMPNCKAYFFPHGDRLSIVLKYGMPLARDVASKKNGDSEGIFYNPQKHDLLIYHRIYDEISLNTPNISDQDDIYRIVIGRHLFEDDDYFKQEKVFSLAELEGITEARSFLSAGVQRASLVELTYDWEYETEIRRSSDLQKSLIRRNKSEIEKKPKIVSAKFKLILDKKGKPQRMVTLENGNKARLDRSEDGIIIEDWVRAQRFLKVEPKTKNEADSVGLTEEAAFA